jgi:hypothetical protein
VQYKNHPGHGLALTLLRPRVLGGSTGATNCVYFIPSAMTGFIVGVFPFRNRVSFTEAFEGLQLGEGKTFTPSSERAGRPQGRLATRYYRQEGSNKQPVSDKPQPELTLHRKQKLKSLARLDQSERHPG